MKKNLLTCLSALLIGSALMAQTTFEPKVTINGSTGNNPYVITSGLMDNDAFADILIGTTVGNTLEWYKNDLTNTGNFIMQTNITTTLTGITSVVIADLNNDGFNDVLAAGYSSDNVVWYANNGSGGFGAEQTISSAVLGAGTIVVANIDAGTTPDVAVVAYDSGDTVWFANDGSGNFTGPNTIASAAGSGPSDLDLGDFDGDGDMDAVISNADIGTIELYDNNLIPSGSVSFTKYTNTVDTGSGYVFDVSFADLNEDMVLDIVKADIGGVGESAYYTKDATGTATTFTEHVLTSSITRPATVTVADFDNDSKNDVLISNAITTGNDLIWLERTDMGTFAEPATAIDNSQLQVYATTVADFDNDTDLDIATVDYQNFDLNWFENNLNPLSVDEVLQPKISMYPNPTQRALNFSGPFTNDFNVAVYDVLGKRVMSNTLKPGQSLDVSKLNNGIYIIKFLDFNTTYKFVKN